MNGGGRQYFALRFHILKRHHLQTLQTPDGILGTFLKIGSDVKKTRPLEIFLTFSFFKSSLILLILRHVPKVQPLIHFPHRFFASSLLPNFN
jgi:hypothetical protein